MGRELASGAETGRELASGAEMGPGQQAIGFWGPALLHKPGPLTRLAR